MFNKIYLYFIIPIGFAILVSRSSGDLGYEAYPIQQCSENATYGGYCIDCEHEMDCINGTDSTPRVCTQDQACRVSKTFSACSDIANVPACSCVGQSGKKPDPYDETKYLLCNNNQRYIFECQAGEVYDSETEACNTPITTTLTTTTMSGCPASGNAIKYVNCTCYRYCLGGGNYFDECCDKGEIYIEEEEKCEFFSPFTCSDKKDGRYSDPHNCSVYHICVNNETLATYNCAEGEIYDAKTETCIQGTTCNAVTDCGVCPDDKTYIKIDCNNFYKCTKNKNSEDPPYVPVVDTCPKGTCFDDGTTYCELQT